MSSISGVGASSNAWANATTQRSQMQAKMFNKVDADSSGGVDQAELQTLFTDISKKTGVSLDAKELFSTMDSNADGSLSGDELSTGMQSVMPPPPSTMAFAQNRSGNKSEDDLFSKVDSNSDGSVDEAEMTTFTDKMKADTGQDSATSFATLDTDSDGKLTQTEFEAGRPAEGTQSTQGSGGVKGAGGPPPGGPGGVGGTSETSSFDPLDTNQDGTVSQLEKLAGALKDFVNSAEASTSDSSASDSLMQLAKQVYEQISSGNTSNSASTLDAVA